MQEAVKMLMVNVWEKIYEFQKYFCIKINFVVFYFLKRL